MKGVHEIIGLVEQISISARPLQYEYAPYGQAARAMPALEHNSSQKTYLLDSFFSNWHGDIHLPLISELKDLK